MVNAASSVASSRHSNVEFGSDDENSKVAEPEPEIGGGELSIVVSGAVVSTVNERVAGL